jgi:hypothetical protein
MRASLSFTLVAFLSAAAVSAQWPGGPARGPANQRVPPFSAAASDEPSWGTQDYSILTLYAWDFEPLDDRIITGTTFPGSYLRYAVSTTAPFEGGHLEAGVHLPSGAQIEAIQLAGCDIAAAVDMSAALYYTPDPSGSSELIGYLVSDGFPGGSDGCGFSTGSTLHTVQNLYGSYAVEVTLPVGRDDVSLRAVRILYRLQVSPAPGAPTFGDVPTSHLFFQFVEALAASGITAGCGGGNFCPDSPLTRGQMAAFLSKALGLHWPY